MDHPFPGQTFLLVARNFVLVVMFEVPLFATLAHLITLGQVAS